MKLVLDDGTEIPLDEIEFWTYYLQEDGTKNYARHPWDFLKQYAPGMKPITMIDIWARVDEAVIKELQP